MDVALHCPPFSGCEETDFDWNDSEIDTTPRNRTKTPSVSSNASEKSTESSESTSGIGGITFVRCVTGSDSPPEEQQEMVRTTGRSTKELSC